MEKLKRCPHCEYQFGENMAGGILYEIRGVYDGWVLWQCPDCGGMWHRWEKEHPVRARVDRWLEKNPEFMREHRVVS